MNVKEAIAQAYALGQSWMEHTLAGRKAEAQKAIDRMDGIMQKFSPTPSLPPPVHWVSGPGDD